MAPAPLASARIARAITRADPANVSTVTQPDGPLAHYAALSPSRWHLGGRTVIVALAAWLYIIQALLGLASLFSGPFGLGGGSGTFAVAKQ